MSINDQLIWHQNLLRASISLNDLKQVERSVRVMLSYPELDKQTDKFVSLLSSLAIFLRRSGHPDESIWLFNHDDMVQNCSEHVNYLSSKSWDVEGAYSSASHPKKLESLMMRL